MKFLADENVPLASVRVLREAGHDVLSIAETAPGSDDRTVLWMAHRESRVLITLDTDFGGLIFREGSARPSAVILFRLPRFDGAEPGRGVLELLASAGGEIQGSFLVIGMRGVRSRPLR